MGLIPSFTVKMDILDVIYLSYLIPEERLRSAVPTALNIASPVAGKAIISLVIFHSRNVRASIFPFLRFTYDQFNLRTYVTDPVTGSTAVFFLKSGITSRFIAAATNLLGIPWQPVSLHLGGSLSDRNTFVDQTITGYWENPFEITLNRNRYVDSDLQPFSSVQEAIHFLTGPAAGFYNTSGGLIRFQVKHSKIEPLTGSISAINCPILSQSGLMTDEETRYPQSLFIAPEGHFTVYMPPVKLQL